MQVEFLRFCESLSSEMHLAGSSSFGPWGAFPVHMLIAKSPQRCKSKFSILVTSGNSSVAGQTVGDLKVIIKKKQHFMI